MQSNVLTQPVEEMQSSLGLVQEKLNDWLDAGVAMLPNLIVAVLVVVVFAVLGRLARSVARRALRKLTGRESIAGLFATLANVLVVFVGLFIALQVMQLDKTVTSLLAGAGVVGIALAFAFQDLAANLIAGVYVSFQRPFVIGDLIETNDVFGIVEAIDLRTTLLKTTSGQIVMIPNKEIFENKLVNYSKEGRRRVELAVGVSYGEDLEKVRDVARDALSALDLRDTRRDVEVFYTGFGGSSIDFVARFWIEFRRQVEYKRAMSEAIIAVKKAFDAHDVTIPFPIRTLDFGIKGGEHLREALPESFARFDSDRAESQSLGRQEAA